ncbi:MAG TPA: hypothetical protein VK927_06215, partial [Adhaeribacter sp.]|nr:hypothetical protein [Adhaeribacter sp.]
MTAENDNLTNENPEKNKNNSNPPAPKEDALSILEKRLAEINARKSGTETPPAASQPAPAQPLPPSAPEKNVAPAAAPTEIKVERTETPAEPADQQDSAATIAGGAVAAHEVIPPAENQISPVNMPDERGPENSAIERPSAETAPKPLPEEPLPAKPEAEAQEPAAPVQPIAFSEGLTPDTTVAGSELSSSPEPVFSAEKDNVLPADSTPTETRETTGTPEQEPVPGTHKSTDSISTFDTSAAGSGTVTEAERDAALGDSNSVGNVISGAIAAHEIIPEIMPGPRAEEEKVNGGTPAPAAGTGT